MDTGLAQELRLVQYLHMRGCANPIRGEDKIKSKLGVPAGPGYKCADVLGFAPDENLIQTIMIAESKGTKVDRALIQLGNTAAAVMERYGMERQVELLLYRSELRALDVGLSPGPGYLVKPGPAPKTFILIDATSDTRFPARAKCDLAAPWNRWNSRLQQYEIQVFVEQA